MSQSPNTTAWNEFSNIWSECCATVLSQVSARSFAARLEDSSLLDGSHLAESSRWFVVQLSDSMAGEMLLRTDLAAAVMLAQLLMAETPDPKAELTADYEDALAELIRQFCGSVSVVLKSVQGSEVPVRLNEMARPAWDPATVVTLQLSDTEGTQLELQMGVGPQLLESLRRSKLNKAPAEAANNSPEAMTAPAPGPAAEQPSATTPATETPTRAPNGLPNLGTLRDIPLDAWLSFGDSIMPLNDVLGCVPGSVVESERALEMPVELWVEGFLAARGDIVIVDGNYGVRVRELCYSQSRGSSLSRGTILAS